MRESPEAGVGVVEGRLPDNRILVRFKVLGAGQLKLLNRIAFCITPGGKTSMLFALDEKSIADGDHGQKRKARQGS